MSETNAQLGFGTTLQRGDVGAATNFAVIGEQKDIGGPNRERNDVDATHQQSPNRTKEYIPGLSEPGEVSLDLQLNETDGVRELIEADMDSSVTRYWRVVYPSGGYYTFRGYIKSTEENSPVEDIQTTNLVVKVAGAAPWTPA